MDYKKYFPIYLKGMAMGIAEVIPGVSGGTIAFITGIYEQFIGALKSIDFSLFSTLKNEGIAGAWKKIDGNFLATLGAGMATSILLFVSIVTHLIEHYPLLLWSFFFGLILASAIYVGKQISNWNTTNIITLIVGAIIAYYVTIAAPANGNDGLIFIFLSGMVAISAMLLPGLSGSFILLLLGMYSIVWGGLKDLDLPVIAAFGGGCVAGILSFSKALNWAFTNHRSLTLSLLTGFIIGSLNRVWPWQEVLSRRVNSKGEEVVAFSKSVLPDSFIELDAIKNLPYGNESQLLMVVLLMLVGFATVFILERISRK